MTTHNPRGDRPNPPAEPQDPRTPQAPRAVSTFARAVASLNDALGYGRDRLPESVVLEASEALERLSRRRELSTEHTIIGFFGATGSGKSTLFNAVAGYPIARSAPTRPTTSAVQAAIWGAEDSDELLDWLGIENRVYPQSTEFIRDVEGQAHNAASTQPAPNAVTEPAPGLFNRIRRMVGRGETRTRTGGLILLDMPDFDSVTTANRELAARMMRYVDVLVWVVDPQKYADAVIHSEFMVPLAASGAQTLCVLNQADKLALSEVPAVLASLTHLMQAEGTDRHLLAPPLAVSARTGEGMDALRDLLAQVAAAKSASLQSTDAQLYAIANELRAYAGGEGTTLTGADALTAERELTQACYDASPATQVLEAATESYRRAARTRTGWIATRWMGRLKADPLRRLHLGTGSEGKNGAKSDAKNGHKKRAEVSNPGMLGGPTQESAPELVAPSLPPLSAAQKANIANAVRRYGSRMGQNVGEPWKRSLDYTRGRQRAPWAVFNVLQWLALLSALVGVAWLTLIAGLGYLQIQLPPPPAPEGFPVPLPTLLVILGVLLGIAAAGLGRLLTAWGARRYARRLRVRLNAGVEGAVRSCVIEPVQAEAQRLQAYRSALEIRP